MSNTQLEQNGIDLAEVLAKANALPNAPSGKKQITNNGTHDVTQYAEAEVNVPTGAARTSADLTASGATVNVPAGLYSEAASKSVASGTAGTPTASKGAVSGNSVTVTPSVTNTTGYITGGTKSGTGVSVSASELVSGNKAISANGTGIDVTNYKTVSVDVPAPSTQSKSATPSLSAQTISPDSGKLLSSVSVAAITKELLAQLDADFVAENIKKDVDLFGLVGALEGGGGGGGYETGTITFSDENTYVPYTITHNLGVIPSIIIYYPTTLFGVTEAPGSNKVIAAIATPEHQFGVYMGGSSSYGSAYICSIEKNWSYSNATSFLRKVNETSFQIGSWGVNYFKAWTYKWVAII